MFSKACALAKEFTKPIIISSRQANGNCNAGIGSYVVINDEGWIVTAYHIIDSIMSMNTATSQYTGFLAERKLIEDDQTLKKHQRINKLNALRIPNEIITNFSVWCGFMQAPQISITNIIAIPDIDLAIGKLEPFDKSWVTTYPTFKHNQEVMQQGSSLCKYGFPFHSITPTFVDGKGFELPPGSLPLPLFPLEGIYTRQVMVQSNTYKPYPLMYIETSSPGLPGQSGGPTFDVHGNIWAIQSSTRHLKLAFGNNNVKGKEAEFLQNQYLHVGWGIHSDTIIGFLKENNINFNLSSH
jgi:hypothetical protein